MKTYTATISVTKVELTDIISLINERMLDTIGERLTLEEVENNSKLLQYLVADYVEAGRDAFECYNSDGFWDVNDYR